MAYYMMNKMDTMIKCKISVTYWNKGYATEIGKGIIKEAFKTTNIIGIYGMAESENVASRRECFKK